MNQTATEQLMTVEEFLALPDDGVERWLIRGRLREKREDPMTKRNRWHSKTEARISGILFQWLEGQPQPRGEIHSGEAGFILRRNPDTTVGIDVAYVSADVAAREPDDTTMIDGIPLLAVEILSPSDTVEEIDEKIDTYVTAGVPLIWVVNTHFRTVTVYQPGARPQMFDDQQELSGDPHLPGFRVPVAKLFGR